MIGAHITKPFLDWAHAEPCNETTLSLPNHRTEWKIVFIPGKEECVAFRRVYNKVSDAMLWVPLNMRFLTAEKAQEAVRDYIKDRNPIFLDSTGEVIPS